MNNILYIIAGLVIILVVGILVLRKNKAQQPSISQRAQPINKNSGHTNTPTTNNQAAMPNQDSVDNVTNPSATKFDNVTIAQRFIDQQRYDKAIETLERGLKEKPSDSQLLLKLLNVYALTNQNDDFHNTYNTIKMHGDAATIHQAQQLKELIDDEQANIVSASTRTAAVSENGLNLESELSLHNTQESSLSVEHENDEMSLDFDLTPSPAPHKIASTPDMNINTDDSHTFDLTLDDLESLDFEQDSQQSHSDDTLDHTDTTTSVLATETLNPDLSDLTTANQINDAAIVNQADTEHQDTDFALDFDTIDTIPENTQETLIEDSQKNQFDLSDDDFALDFDSLEEDTVTEHQPVIMATEQDMLNDDFTLLLDDEEQSEPEIDTVNIIDADTAPTHIPAIQDDDIDFSLDNADVEDNAVKNTVDETIEQHNDFIELEFSDTDISFDSDHTASTPTLDDDHITFNDDMGFEVDTETTSITPMMPVTSDNDIIELDSAPVDHNDEVLLSSNITEQFATDFDFVNTLDNNQVTLDLANQYLQLGEYDSAKRLLNEVVAQGNSEQQQQAKELLALTA